MPIKEKTRVVAEGGTEREYFPSAPVLIPVVVPFTNTETPASVPSDSTEDLTVPVIILFCAGREEALINRMAKIRKNNFFIGKMFY